MIKHTNNKFKNKFKSKANRGKANRIEYKAQPGGVSYIQANVCRIYDKVIDPNNLPKTCNGMELDYLPLKELIKNRITLKAYNEVFVNIYEHPKYYISNYGRVYSRITGKLAGQYLTKEDGYNRVMLDKKNELVHRLVAEYFVPTMHRGMPYSALVIHHRDGNQHNNVNTNLQWLTPEEHKAIHRKRKKPNRKKAEVYSNYKYIA